MWLGIGILLLAGICQGSFGLGYKKYHPLSWEAFWGIYMFFCAVITVVVTFILVPNALDYYRALKDSELLFSIVCGMLWGISAVGFSKGVDYIGMSLVYGLSMGISSVVGGLLPMIRQKIFLPGKGMFFLILGMVITLAGIGVVTYAGILKERKQENKSVEKGKFSKGIIMALLSGLGSAAMNMGFDTTGVGNIARIPYIQSSAIQWMPVLVGGAFAGIVYCVIQLTKNKTWHTYALKGAIPRFGMLFLTGIVWFLALYLYGIAANTLGRFGTSIGWVVFNALALLISNGWGIKTGEWTGYSLEKKKLFIGNAILIISWFFVALAQCIS